MSRTRDQGGFLLLQVAFFLLVLMGLAALVIDMGIARATQGFMQSSADAASLDGLRYRDVNLEDRADSDLQRRMLASRAASLVHDEDLDLDTAPQAYLLGAGPQIETGVGGIDDPAGGLLVGRDPYLPGLALNEVENAVHGDLVAGEFLALDPAAPGNPNWHQEPGSYVRQDFQASSAADAPQANAFLARLRRSNDTLGLDRLAGVSTAGPTLPFLFGLGSGVLSSERPDLYDPRRDGITVRATAIADARPVVAAGLARDGILGVAQVALENTIPGQTRVLSFDDVSWRTDLLTGGLFEVVVFADGSISGTPAGPSPAAAGMAQPAAGLLRVGASALSAPRGAVTPALIFGGLEGVLYTALYVPSAAPPFATLTGFGAVRIDSALLGTDTAGQPSLTLSGVKLESLIAPENASAIATLALDVAALQPVAVGREPLLAPVLVR